MVKITNFCGFNPRSYCQKTSFLPFHELIMQDNYKVSFNWQGRNFSLEKTFWPEYANGAVIAQYGETVVLATAVMGKTPKDVNYFPLTVEYEEKFYAAGKILGGRFIKRENRPSEEAILTGRLVDRSIRPLFNHEVRNEVQVIITILSIDGENDPDVVAMLAASATLHSSDIPWSGPIGAVRVGYIDGKLMINPTKSQMTQSKIDLVLSGTKEKINMMEAGANEVAEEIFIKALELGQREFSKLIDLQNQITKHFNVEKIKPELKKFDEIFVKKVKDFLEKDLYDAIYVKSKAESYYKLENLRKKLLEWLGSNHKEELQEKTKLAEEIFEKEINDLVHKEILEHDKRPDGRRLDEVREIEIIVPVLPRTHGSALFRRGTTRALSVLTLGAPGDEQIIEGMEIQTEKHFMHHYNFPPFSVGELGPRRGPSRRDIGHGALAERALLPMIPPKEEFPYTIRLVSEILSSNGSSSMASTCGSTLALMDGGVPIKKPVSGIAMGLILDVSDKYKVLTDIQGPEDHHGDMDCKIAGTHEGITAAQMDVKIEGVTLEILEKTLHQAKKARLEILEKMQNILSKPRSDLSPLAPRITTLQINPEKIGAVIGPQGKVINQIIKETGATIDIEDSGLVFITATSEASSQKAIDWIKSLTREAKIGEIYDGKVTRTLDFGAFVEILPGTEGMIHVSELGNGEYVNKASDVVRRGDPIRVRVKNIDEIGRINLELADKKPGVTAPRPEGHPRRNSGGPRGRQRMPKRRI